MLGARYRQAVAWNDDDRLSIAQDEGCVVGTAAFHRALFATASASRYGVATKATQDDIEEAAVHGFAHDVAQDRAARANQRTGDDQHRVVQREADTRCRPA